MFNGLTANTAHGLIDQNWALFTITQMAEIGTGVVATIEGFSANFDAEMVAFWIISFTGFTADSLAFMGSARLQFLANSITHKYSFFLVFACGLPTFDLSFILSASTSLNDNLFTRSTFIRMTHLSALMAADHDLLTRKPANWNRVKTRFSIVSS